MLLFVCLCVSFLSLQEYPMINTLSFVIGDRRGSWERKEAKKNMGVLRDMAAFLLVTELVAMELVLPLVEVWSNHLTVQIVSSLRSFSSLPVSVATPCSSILHSFPPLSHLLHPLALLLTLKEADMLHKVYNECSSCHPVSFWHSYSFNISGSSVGGRIFHKSLHGAWGDKITLKSNIHLLEGS